MKLTSASDTDALWPTASVAATAEEEEEEEEDEEVAVEEGGDADSAKDDGSARCPAIAEM